MPASSSAAGSACIRARPMPRTSMSARMSGIEIGGHPRRLHRAGQRPGRHHLVPQDRRRATRTPSSRRSVSRYDELDGQMWLDDVFVPWERVFFRRPVARADRRAGCAGTTSMAGSPRRSSPWVWRWRLTDAMGLKEHEQTIEYLVDLDRRGADRRAAASTAAERDPDFTPAGYCFPNHRHLAPGGIAIFKARQRMSEILRILPGSSLVVAPSDQRSRRARAGRGPRRVVWRRRVHRIAARGPAAARAGIMSPRHSMRREIGVRAACQRRHAELARLAAPATSATTTSWPMRCWAQLDLPMPKIDLSGIRAAPIARAPHRDPARREVRRRRSPMSIAAQILRTTGSLSARRSPRHRHVAARLRQHDQPPARRFRRRGDQDRGPEEGRSVARLAEPRASASIGRSIRATRRASRSSLREARGRELLLRLVATAQVLIENFRPGTLEAMGLGPEILHERNPGLIIVRVSGWGQDGPYRDRPGFGTLVESMSGYAARTGFADREPALAADRTRRHGRRALRRHARCWSRCARSRSRAARARSSICRCSTRCSRSSPPRRRSTG